MGLGGSVAALLRYLRAGCAAPRPVEALLNEVVVDRRYSYREPLGLEEVAALGVKVIEADLGYAQNREFFDAGALAPLLVSMGMGGV